MEPGFKLSRMPLPDWAQLTPNWVHICRGSLWWTGRVDGNDNGQTHNTALYTQIRFPVLLSDLTIFSGQTEAYNTENPPSQPPPS